MSSFECPTCHEPCIDLGRQPGKGHVYEYPEACTGGCEGPERAFVDALTPQERERLATVLQEMEVEGE